jgi:hypothetical protein
VNHPEELNQPEERHQPAEALGELEQYLTQALRPVDPPASLTERILAHAEFAPQGKANVVRIGTRTRVWASSAIAAGIVAGFLIGGQIHARRERQKVELAQRQFDAALKITSDTLEQTRRELQQAGIDIGD